MVMHRKRFNLPPLDLIQGFEAAARTLSFTKAAEELFLTQSAVSRQIRALEEYLGVALFERRPRRLELTEQGRALYRTAVELLERLQETTNRLRSDAAAPHLTVTTTGGFASLWLIPRLRAFTVLHPEVDVRISANYKTIDLERSLVDVAVRYCQAEDVPGDAVRLFGEELFPVCSPDLQARGLHPLRTLADLQHHALLHMNIQWSTDPLDWDTWLAARGHPGLKPAASLRFDNYEQMIQAAAGGQGVAMGIGRLVSGLMASGQLVAPFGESTVGSRAYFIIRSTQTRIRPHVSAFVDWLVEEAKAALAAEDAASLGALPLPSGLSGADRRARAPAPVRRAGGR
jgi:LysR family transcriptional regulator, glycine cleavage system transcriptional activator